MGVPFGLPSHYLYSNPIASGFSNPGASPTPPTHFGDKSLPFHLSRYSRSKIQIKPTTKPAEAMKSKIRPSALQLRQPAAAGALLITVLASSPLHASTIWDGGGTSGGWGQAANWSDDVAPTFNNTTDLSFPTSSVTQFNSFLGANRIVRSLSFGAEVDSAFSISFQTAAGAATGANLTFDTDAVGGNATVTVDSDATGAITLGSALGGTNLNPILADNLVVDHNGSGLLLINRPFQAAAFGITKNGTGTMQLNNNNLLTGALNINAGTLVANTSTTTGDDLDNFSAVNLGGGTLQIGANFGVAKTYNLVPLNVNAASTLEYKNASNTTQTVVFSTTGFVLNADLAVKNVSTDTTLVNGINLSRVITGSGDMAITTYNNIVSTADSFGLGRVLLTGDNSAWNGDLSVARGTVSLGGTAVNAAGNGVITIGTALDTFGAGVTFFPQGPNGSTITYANNITATSGGFRAIKGGGTDHNVRFTGNVTLDGNLTVDHSWGATNRRLWLSGNVSGAGGLTITRVGGSAGTTALLSGANTYLGNTTVTTGASLSLTGSLTSDISVATGARFGGNGGSTNQDLTMAAGANFIFVAPSFATFNVTGTVTLDNSFGVSSLVGGSQGEAIDWSMVSNGTYTLIGTPASTFNNITNFGVANAAEVGGGKTAYFQNASGLQLVVTSAGSGFSAWQATNGATGGLDEDHDKDGVSNGVEYFVGGSTNTTGFTALPGVTNSAGVLSVTFVRATVANGYSGNYDTDFVVETSTSLATGSWTPALTNASPDVAGTVFISGSNVTYTFPAGTKTFARLKVTGP